MNMVAVKVEYILYLSFLTLKFCVLHTHGSAPLRTVPEFRAPIKNVTVAVGREAILECSVNHLGNYKVAWIRADQTILSVHNRVITHNPRISITYDDNPPTWKLHIRQLKETDQACYVCQINTDSMQSQYGCVQVQVPPDINDTETSGDVTVNEGDNATLVCKASGHPEPRILWRREDSNALILHPRPHETDKVDSYSGSALALTKIERQQMGAYLCIASNEVPPAVSKRIMLNVNFTPTIKVPNQILGAPLNTDVQLECHVEAFPNAINYWLKAKSTDVLLSGQKHTVVEKQAGYKVHMILLIHNIQKHDIGTYHCIAKNSMGKEDGSIRLYEIKIPTTTTTMRTTEMKTVPITSTTTTYHTTTTTPKTTTITFGALLDEIDNNFIPSAEPAPLETLMSSVSSSATIENTPYILKLLLILILLKR